MATGNPFTSKVEIEFVTGFWTDVTIYLDAMAGMVGKYGRADPFTDVTPGSWRLTLFNDDGRFTPDNPVSPYYPNVIENKRLRVSFTKSGTTYVRFLGYISAITPDFAEENSTRGTVQIEASDVMSRLAQSIMDSEFLEYANSFRTQVDAFIFSGKSATTRFVNQGYLPVGSTTPVGTARVYVPQTKGFGKYEISQDDGARFDNVLKLTAASGVGPSLYVTTSQAPGVINMTYKLPADGQTPSNGNTHWILEAYRDNTFLFGVGAYATSQTQIEIFAHTSARTRVSPSLTPGIKALDDVWRGLTITQDPDTPTTFYVIDDDTQATATLTGLDMSTVNRLWIAGSCSPRTPGRQTNTPTLYVGSVFIANDPAYSVTGARSLEALTNTETNSTRLAELVKFAVPITVTATTLGADDRLVRPEDIAGETVLSSLQMLARSIGGLAWSPPSADSVVLIRPDALRSSTVALTVNVEADDDGSLKWERAIDSKPSRVTVSSVGGTAVAIDSTLEAQGVRRDVSVETMAADVTGAYEVGTYYLNRAVTLRAAELPVNLTTATADLYTAVFALEPGDRVRLNGTPSSIFGYTYVDQYVEGWEESWHPDGVVFKFDCSPADAPGTDALFTDSTYGRFCATDGTLALASDITSGGTTVRVAPLKNSYPVLSTSAGDYPADIDVAGERMTIASAPGTASRTNLCVQPSFETSGTGGAVASGLVSTLDNIASNGTVPTSSNSNITAVANNSPVNVTQSTAVSAPHGNATVTRWLITSSNSPFVYWNYDKWSTIPTGTTVYMRGYFYFPSIPSATSVGLFAVTTPTLGTMANIRVDTAGKIRAFIVGGTQLGATGTVTIPTNAWFRFEAKVFIDGTNGFVNWRLFTTVEGTTAAEDVTTTTGNTSNGQTAIKIVGYGPTGGTSSITYYGANFQASDSDWIGPYGAALTNYSTTFAGKTACTSTRDSSRAYIGLWSTRIDWPTASAGGSTFHYVASGLSIGQTYAVSFYAYVPSGSKAVRIAEAGGAGTVVSYLNGSASSGTLAGGWTRLGVIFTATATTHNWGVQPDAAVTAGTDYCYVDGFLIELANNVGSYFDGDNGGSWTGTTQLSTSTQTVQTMTVTRGVAPTVARAHTAGDAVDAWLHPSYAF